MFRRRIPFTQIAFTTMLGVAGGFYIYRPYFEPEVKTPQQRNQEVKTPQQRNQEEPKKQNETELNKESLPGNTSHTEATKTTPEAPGLVQLETEPKTKTA